MINSKDDLAFYLAQDKKVMGIPTSKKRPKLYGDELWKFTIILRYHEYYSNCYKTKWDRIMLSLFSKLHHYYGIHLGFEIPVNTFEYGLKLNHIGPIIVNPNVRVGAFCDIHVGVNIGQNLSPKEVPTIGENVWIGPGVKIFGQIEIADGIMIGANSVVNKSFIEKDITIAGVPAKKINDRGGGGGNPFKRTF